MEKIYTNTKLSKAWQKEARGRTGHMWWFDLDDYGTDMKLDGESPIICNDEPILELECWNTLKGSACMLLLRNGMKTVMAVVHEKGGGLRFYSRQKTSFNKSSSIMEDTPGVFLLVINWKTYAQLGLVKSVKKYLYSGFKPEVVYIDPKIGTLVDWNLGFVMEQSLKRLSKKRVQNILEQEVG
jgi:hypothetical protein